MTDEDIESFIRQHASIEKGVALAIAWRQVEALRSIAESLMKVANPVMVTQPWPIIDPKTLSGHGQSNTYGGDSLGSARLHEEEINESGD